MAGIYLHIPFCKRKCAYCDFYSIANTNLKSELVKALKKEIELRKDFLGSESIKTIYFGGGTPSLLSINEIDDLVNTIDKYYKVEINNEITLEANPDDLNNEFLRELSKTSVNRLSIGIQSFIDTDLQLMKRLHSSQQAIRSVLKAQDNGFNNISIDLIYGLPNLTLADWELNINKGLNLNVQHISAYHLTIEPNTLFNKYYKNKKIVLPTENESLDQFKILKDKTAEKGFVHYEISNFALDGFLSLHNTNYWMDVKYLGLGPSAHSYNLTSREWNISNLSGYLDAIFQGKLANETEILSKSDQFNDYLITSLRTMWGLNTEIINTKYGLKYLNHILEKSKKFITLNLLEKQNNTLKLSEKGMFVSDSIIQDLLFD